MILARDEEESDEEKEIVEDLCTKKSKTTGAQNTLERPLASSFRGLHVGKVTGGDCMNLSKGLTIEDKARPMRDNRTRGPASG